MAEEKEPERKKLSLQGTKKLSLGSGPDLLKTNRNNRSKTIAHARNLWISGFNTILYLLTKCLSEAFVTFVKNGI